MTEREVKQLIKLLEKFAHHKVRDPQQPVYEKMLDSAPQVRMIDGLSNGEIQAVNMIRQWVRYYGRDDLELDL